MQKNASKKNIQYPAPLGPYKVSIKGKSSWQQYKTARLQISIGNTKQEGEKLFAMTEWLSHRFDKVIFIVSDTLQKHNLGSYDEALRQGKEWLQSNKEAIEVIPEHKRVITTWDDWLSHPDYAAAKAEIDRLFDQNLVLKEAIHSKALEFCSRSVRLVDQANDFDTAINYLLEELAAFAVMFRETPAADFYAGSWLENVYRALAEVSNSDLLSGFKAVNFTEVDFVRNQGYRDDKATERVA